MYRIPNGLRFKTILYILLILSVFLNVIPGPSAACLEKQVDPSDCCLQGDRSGLLLINVLSAPSPKRDDNGK
jgi:hypothetical protein